MKKYLLSLVLVMLALPVFAAPTAMTATDEYGLTIIFFDGGKEVAREVYGKDGNYKATKGDIPDGVYTFNYKDGKTVRFIYTYKGGMKVAAKVFTPEGSINYESEYSNRILNGKKNMYFKDGTKRQALNYKNGKKDGLNITYHDNGKVESEENYVNGQKQGKRTRYYPDGTVEEDEIYKDDSLDGLCKKFWENGKLKEELTYKAGTAHGVIKKYYDNGNMSVQATYVEGVVTGSVKRFDPTGKLMSDKVEK